MVFYLLALGVVILGPLAFTRLSGGSWKGVARTGVKSGPARWRNLLAILLLGIGCLQMAGGITGWRLLQDVGLASGISPRPQAFSAVEGYEAFASSCRLEGTLGDGRRWSQPVDPEWYSRLTGPHPRRNAYGAALSQAPLLPDPLRESFFSRVLPPGSALRTELGVPGSIEDLTVVIHPRAGRSGETWRFSATP